jgi:hypothetical protein
VKHGLFAAGHRGVLQLKEAAGLGHHSAILFMIIVETLSGSSRLSRAIFAEPHLAV